jgi:2-polyprenyl-6-methoxyphenol hydroxylase-like FAD-dependent oxidoreductase
MRVVVIGAGVGGLGAALALSRQGHDVTVLERDRTPLPHDPDEAFEWDRRGAPQVRHSHAMLARLRNLLRDRYPDVLAALYAAGVTDWPLTAHLPETIDDPGPQPGDDDLVMLACRRTTFEWVLRSTVLAAPHVSLLDGVAVDGLMGGGGIVTGVRATVDGETKTFNADVVVAANGRRGDVPAWLAGVGADCREVEEDTGIIYLSRFYRLLDGADVPEQIGPIGGDLGYLKYATFIGDNRTFSVTFAVPVDDAEMRAKLLDPSMFERAGRVLVATEPWVDPARAEPITPVHVMAKLLNRLRTFDGVLGFHAVGDAHTCTNPLYGRGCSLAMVQATLLADAVAAHPDDAAARCTAYERASAEQIEPWYHASVMADRDNRASTGSRTPADESDPRNFFRSVLRDGLGPAMRIDQRVFRAFLRTFNLLTTPDALMRDGELITRVVEVYNDRENRAPEPELGPKTREDFLAQL